MWVCRQRLSAASFEPSLFTLTAFFFLQTTRCFYQVCLKTTIMRHLLISHFFIPAVGVLISCNAATTMFPATTGHPYTGPMNTVPNNQCRACVNCSTLRDQSCSGNGDVDGNCCYQCFRYSFLWLLTSKSIMLSLFQEDVSSNRNRL